MSNLVTLGEVKNKVYDLSMACYDKLVPVKDIEFNKLDSVKIRGESYPLKPTAQYALSNRLGIPIQYLRKCPPDLQAVNLNYWLTKERNENLFFRFDGEEVRAVFTPKYKPVDNWEIIEKLNSLGYAEDTKVQCYLDEEFMVLSVLDGKEVFSVNGDRFAPGISISNSEVGLASLSIAAFVLRLVCTNGAISKTQVSASYRHVSLKILKELPEVIKNVSLDLVKQRDQYRISLESRVADPLATIESFNKQFQLGEKEKEAVKWGWFQEVGETMFHVVNAYTRAAQFPGLTAESCYRLQKVGGCILGMVK